MKPILVFFALLTFSATAGSRQTVTEFNWKDPAQTGLPRGTAPVLLDGRAALKIENTNVAPLQLSLLTIAKPKISAQMYAVQGEVRYDAVQGDGYLEMWNYFPPVKPGLPEGQYFSRTLGDSGEMGKISGTSDWRPFSLPFDSAGASGPPTELQINLILRGRGTVYLGPIKLVQYPVAKSFFYGNTAHPWWSHRAYLWVMILGSGIFIGFNLLIVALSVKGKGRGFVFALLRLLIGLGILLGATTIVAFAQQQPFWVWFPLLLEAFLLITIFGAWLFTVGRIYQELELRRMQALDASG
jgi:hypothetical protein